MVFRGHAVAPAAIDFHLDGAGFNAIDRSGQNTGEHLGMLGECGRNGTAVFAGWHLHWQTCKSKKRSLFANSGRVSAAPAMGA